MNDLRIFITIDDNGIMSVAFPNADIIETESGPMMGFNCSVSSAMWIGGSIISAAVSYASSNETQEEGNND